MKPRIGHLIGYGIAFALYAAIFCGLWLLHPSAALIIGGMFGIYCVHYFSDDEKAKRAKAAAEKEEAARLYAEISARNDRLKSKLDESLERVSAKFEKGAKWYS